MNQPKASPRPWKAVPAVNQETFKDYFEIYRVGHTEAVASISPYLHDAEANAQLIVSTVNSKDVADEMAREILRFFDSVFSLDALPTARRRISELARKHQEMSK